MTSTSLSYLIFQLYEVDTIIKHIFMTRGTGACKVSKPGFKHTLPDAKVYVFNS
jgi:hypothetical protein